MRSWRWIASEPLQCFSGISWTCSTVTPERCGSSLSRRSTTAAARPGPSTAKGTQRATPAPSASNDLGKYDDVMKHLRSTSGMMPRDEDYRALLLDLLLYRQESLLPLLKALQNERHQLQRSMKRFDAKVRKMSRVRNDIRRLLLEHEAKRDAELASALIAAGGHTASSSPAATSDVENDAEDEFEL